ncbi:hypothetical protein GR927_32925 [Mycolicibacterium sp. 3033]|nr:hypothetical protein [Mycolicibacterium aurantiacum]
MTALDHRQLRQLVREVVRDALADLGPSAPAPPAPPAPDGPIPSGPLTADERFRTEAVRITSDAELAAFARHLLHLFENPKNRADLRAGRLTFRLAGVQRGSGASARRVERGAVTERQIAELAGSGATLVLGPRAVLTPLARERARALGVTIEKERR